MRMNGYRCRRALHDSGFLAKYALQLHLQILLRSLQYYHKFRYNDESQLNRNYNCKCPFKEFVRTALKTGTSSFFVVTAVSSPEGSGSGLQRLGSCLVPITTRKTCDPRSCKFSVCFRCRLRHNGTLLPPTVLVTKPSLNWIIVKRIFFLFFRVAGDKKNHVLAL